MEKTRVRGAKRQGETERREFQRKRKAGIRTQPKTPGR